MARFWQTGVTRVAFVRSFQKLPSHSMKPETPSSRSDPLLAKAEPICDGGSGESYCAGGIAAGESSESMWGAALQTQELAEGRAGAAPAPRGSPVEVPQGGIVVGQLCLLSGAHGGPHIRADREPRTLGPCGKTTLEASSWQDLWTPE